MKTNIISVFLFIVEKITIKILLVISILNTNIKAIWWGVIIDDNPVVADNSLVTKNILSNTLIGGDPAKFIKNLPYN